MRTTVELPPDLMRAAKARSAERGESLKALLTRAVAEELGQHRSRPGGLVRVSLPLFGATSGPRVRLSNADLERALADADTDHARPASVRRPKRSRGGRSR